MKNYFWTCLDHFKQVLLSLLHVDARFKSFQMRLFFILFFFLFHRTYILALSTQKQRAPTEIDGYVMGRPHFLLSHTFL